MAKRVLKASTSSVQASSPVASNGEAEKLPASAADLLDSVPVTQPNNTGAEIVDAGSSGGEQSSCHTSTPAETHSAPTPASESEPADFLPPADAIGGPCTYCGDPNHWRPNCPKIAAHVTWQQQLQDAKDDHLQACLELESAQNTVKGLRERAKEALNYYRELEARGPVIPKPADPIASSSAAPESSPLPVGDDANGWRAIPLDSLPLDTIRGLGGKKRDALLECCPNLGAFVDKQVEAGASGVDTVLPKGIGKAITDPLEEMVLNKLAEWNRERSQGEQSSQGDGVTEASQEGATGGNNAGDTGVTDALPSFTEWEIWTDEKRHDWLMARAVQISEGPHPFNPDKLTAAWQSGQLAYSRGDEAKHCPHIPGEELDDWLAGFFAAAADDDDRTRKRIPATLGDADEILGEANGRDDPAEHELETEPEPELAHELAGAAAGPASNPASSLLDFDLDSI